MRVCDRQTGKVSEEKQYKGELLDFLYHRALGRILLKIAILPVYSRFNGWLNNRKQSAKKVAPFIAKYGINMSRYEKQDYANFNEFFTRKPRIIKFAKTGLLAPCEGKLLVYRIDDNLKIHIKNSDYTLQELTQEGTKLEEFKNGLCLVYHLTMDCCHRYYFIDDGIARKSKSIKGKLHTVSSISKDYKIYKENHRVVSLHETKNFGNIYYIEIGAIQVGKIINHSVRIFRRGQEKGFFKLGGSTIILLMKDKKAKIDQDILDNSSQGIETRVNFLEKVGVKYVA